MARTVRRPLERLGEQSLRRLVVDRAWTARAKPVNETFQSLARELAPPQPNRRQRNPSAFAIAVLKTP